MIGKRCIICRQLKQEFNEEHVFPAVIHGEFKIKTVCAVCNGDLGKYIDNPFGNHKEILLYRHHFGLNRGSRAIKNPFGKQKLEDGNDFIVMKGTAGFEGHQLPNLEIIETEQGPVGLVTMSAALIKSPVEAVATFSKQFEQITGYPVGYCTLQKDHPKVTYTAYEKDSDNKLIWEFLKIAYETAVTYIPQYFEDEFAIAYSKMLKVVTFDREYLEFLNPSPEKYTEFTEVLNRINGLDTFSCYVALYQDLKYGLICSLRIFGASYHLILSPKTNYLDDRVLIAVNDSLNKKFYSIIVKRPKKFNISLEGSLFSKEHMEELGSNGQNHQELFYDGDQKIGLYIDNGELLLPNLEILTTVPLLLSEHALLARMDQISIPFESEVYLRSGKSQLLYRLLAVNFVF